MFYRLAPDSGAAWLATAAVFGTGRGLGLAALHVVVEERVPARSGWMMLTQLLVAVILVALLVLHRFGAPPVDPLGLGLCLAVVVSVTRLAVLELGSPSTPWHAWVPYLGGLLLVLYGVMALLLLRSDRLPSPARWRLGLVIVLLGTAQLLIYPLPPDDWRSLVAAVLNVGGAVVLGVTAIHLVRTAMDHQAETDERVRVLEGDVRVERTLLHEVAGSVAGIGAATRLLTLHAGLGQGERARLTDLLVAETARMDRLIAAGHDLSGPQPITDVDLDDLLEPLLLAHGIRGRVVAWHPSRVGVRARRDDLMEVLGLLLDNAARHTRTPILAVTITRRGDEVDVTVVDQGEGISPEIAELRPGVGRPRGVLHRSGDRPQRRAPARHRHGRSAAHRLQPRLGDPRDDHPACGGGEPCRPVRVTAPSWSSRTMRSSPRAWPSRSGWRAMTSDARRCTRTSTSSDSPLRSGPASRSSISTSASSATAPS